MPRPALPQKLARYLEPGSAAHTCSLVFFDTPAFAFTRRGRKTMTQSSSTGRTTSLPAVLFLLALALVSTACDATGAGYPKRTPSSDHHL